MPDLSLAEVVLRIVLAAALGGAIGLERELREREAGLRTHLLVSVGAALFTMVSAYAWTDWRFSNEEGLVFDPTRIAAQVVTGIGFLGAGAIIRQGLSVRGLTTAATLWVVAAIGMASGVGYYWAALVTTALVLVSLWPLRIVAFRLSARTQARGRTPRCRAAGGHERRLRARGRRECGRRRQLARVRGGGRPPQGGRARAAGIGQDGGPADRRPHTGRSSPRRPLESVRAVLASANPGKLRELRRALPDWEIEPLDADDYPPETGETYYENARAKALFGREREPGRWVLGEDSGLEVAGLDGAPGIKSARFAGGLHVERLLAELEGVEGAARGARYVCELVALSPEGEEHRGTGILEGRIAEQPSGSEGFGFDPVFIPDGEERTAAELGDAWKAENSHRARAARALAEALP